MIEQSKQNKAGKPGYYFKIIPKEEFPKFLDRLKEALEKIENKKGDKKIIDFEIRGTKEDLDGLSLEIFTFDESKYDDFIDIEQEHIKNALYFFSLNFNVKTEVDVEKLKNVYEKFKPMIEAMPIFKDKLKFCFRNKGTKVSFDFVGKEGKLFSDLMSLGIDPAEYRKFYFALILGVNLTEIFDPTADQAEIFVKIFSVIFSIKSETDNVKYLIKALVEALKDVKLSDKNIQKKFDKFVRYLSFIYSFIGVKLNIEYDAKVLTTNDNSIFNGFWND